MKENVDHVGALKNLFQQLYKCVLVMFQTLDQFFNSTKHFILLWKNEQHRLTTHLSGDVKKKTMSRVIMV